MAFKKWTASAEIHKPDGKYNSLLISKFINCLMWRGKKSVATLTVYEALEIVGRKIKDVPPLEVFETAIDNVKPELEVRSKRVGGANYQVPMPVNSRRRQSLAIRWVLDAARKKAGKPMSQRLAEEFMAAFKREGAAMTTRDNVHKMAEANKAFAHFAW
ncbi:MAG: 30S ribosomal protein S7 [Phycisphaerae bacterium]